ncbi:CotD family spore coat protein [Bacillus sp. CGMCC 1.16607]|uniref:CotD family spore coat protein n=1 Tax=Bacillus sp. CGMCC 1.16607 TaxID=3351842 RepID=UPI00363D629F
MFCRPNNILPAIVHPTKCCTNHTFANTIVPHIHPSHTTTVNHQNFQHKHYFPHTQSVVGEVTHQHFNCSGPGPGMAPGFGAGPGVGMGPGFGAGPGMSPGFGPGPGMYPGVGR